MSVYILTEIFLTLSIATLLNLAEIWTMRNPRRKWKGGYESVDLQKHVLLFTESKTCKTEALEKLGMENKRTDQMRPTERFGHFRRHKIL